MEAVAGVPVVFGDPLSPPPQGATVSWDFGDGETGEGAVIAHAFRQSGEYTVRATAGGAEPSVARVTVVPRRPAASVPPDARSAVILDRVWHRMGSMRAVIGKLGFGASWDRVVDAVQESLGFDPMIDQGQVSAGLDPEEGVAMYTPSGSDEDTLLAIGVRDQAAAEKTLRTVAELLAEEPLVYSESWYGGARMVYGRPASGGPPFVYAFRHGYLVVRLPGEGGEDPARPVREWLGLPPSQGLDHAQEFLTTTRRLDQADALLFVARGPMQEAAERAEETAPRHGLSGRLRRGTGSLAMAVRLGSDRVAGTFHLGLSPDAASELMQVLVPAAAAPALLSGFPPDALLAAHLAADPRRMFELALGEGSGRTERRAGAVKLLAEISGEPDGLAALTRALSGHLALAAYVDVNGLVQGFLSPGGLGKAWGVVGALSLGDPALAARMLEGAVQHAGSTLRADVARGPESTVYSVEGAPLAPLNVTVHGQALLFSLNRELPLSGGGLDVRLPPLAQDRQWIWGDLARAVDGLTDAALPEDAPLGQGLMLGLAQQHAARLGVVRAAHLVFWPAADGLEAELTIQLR